MASILPAALLEARDRVNHARSAWTEAEASYHRERRIYHGGLIKHLKENGFPADLASLSEDDFGAIYSAVCREIGQLRVSDDVELKEQAEQWAAPVFEAADLRDSREAA